MDEDWRNTFGILMKPLRQGHGVWPRFCTKIVILHIKSKVMKSRILWCKNFASEACLGITRGQKVGSRVQFPPPPPPPTTPSHTTEIGSILSWRVDHEIFSTVILSLLLIQEGQLSVSGKRMCAILVNRLRGLSLPSKSGYVN